MEARDPLVVGSMMWWMLPALLLWRIRTATPFKESRRGTPCVATDEARRRMLKPDNNARRMNELAITGLRVKESAPTPRQTAILLP